MELRGAGSFLDKALYTGEHRSESIHTIADAVLNSVVNDGDYPVTAIDTDNSGVTQRKISVDFKNTPVNRALKKLATFAGGPSRVAWGVRPSAASSNFGTAYFKVWAGHLWEKDASVDRRIHSVSDGKILSYLVEPKSGDVVNEATVIGDEIGGDPAVTDKEFYSATAKSPESIADFGKRSRVIHDSGLQNDGQCAVVAHGAVQESASRRIAARLRFLEDPGNRVMLGSGEAYNVLYDLKKPAKILLPRHGPRTFRNWGHSKLAYHAERDASTPRYLKVDTANGPTGADIVIQDPATLGSGDQRLYAFTTAYTDNTYSSQGLNIMEVRRRLGLIWLPSASVWVLHIVRLNSAGTTWNSIANSGATTRTNAQLAAEHLTALEVKYLNGTQNTYTAYWSDGTTVTQMCTVNENRSSIYSTGTPQEILLNAVGSSNSSTDPQVPGDSSGADYSILHVWRAYSTPVTTFLGLHDDETPAFKHWKDLVLMTNFALTEDGGAQDSALVRYALGNTTRPCGYDAVPVNAAATSQFEESELFTRRNYDWLLGNDRAPAAYGTHLEVYPERAKVAMRHLGGPLLIDVQGDAGTRPMSDLAGELVDRVQEAEEIGRKGFKK